jgi:hypothetical protein
MPDDHAMVLIHLGKVERYKPPAPKPKAEAETAAEQPRRRGRPPKAETKSMTAEDKPADTTEESNPEPEALEQKEEIPANRNTYQTRDLKAE